MKLLRTAACAILLSYAIGLTAYAQTTPTAESSSASTQPTTAPSATASSSNAPESQAQKQVPPRGRFDSGIYLGRANSGDQVCGSIVSYNFSPGQNPYLESITNCTPSGRISTYRARGKKRKPVAPQLRTTEYSTSQP